MDCSRALRHITKRVHIQFGIGDQMKLLHCSFKLFLLGCRLYRWNVQTTVLVNGDYEKQAHKSQAFSILSINFYRYRSLIIYRDNASKRDQPKLTAMNCASAQNRMGPTAEIIYKIA